MGFMLPALPAIAQGGATLAGGLFAKKSQKGAMQRSPEEQQALTGAQGLAGTAGRMGQSLLGESRPWLGQAGNYFQTLLQGNRAAMAQATAAPAADITARYRGAQRGLEQSGLRGAARDVATADLNRQRASDVAGLVTGMQPQAAQALAGLGQTGLQLGGGLLGTGGTLYGNLLGQAYANRKYAREQGQATGENVGGLLRDIAGSIPWGKFGRGKTSEFGPFAGGYKFPEVDQLT